jgi:hypothetical protein
MIKGLQGISGLTVQGGNTALPYVGPNIQNPMTGMMRINGTEMEVFNGSSWLMLSTSYATVGLDQDTLDIIHWARKKRDQELEHERMAKEHPAVQYALTAVKRAEEQLVLIANLSKEHGEALESSQLQ